MRFRLGIFLLGVAIVESGAHARGPNAGSGQAATTITVDYPRNGSIFPPEFPAPTFEWRDPVPEATSWRVEVRFADGSKRLSARSQGERLRLGEIDPRCVSETNKPPELTPEQSVGHTWKPDAETWSAIKQHSVQHPATVLITGFKRDGASKPISLGKVVIQTSSEPVGAPVFYRDVPLMPSELQKGVIKPLAARAVPLIAWRLRDLGESSSRVLLEGMHTCANCHSFSADGKTLGMDIDGPANDKGLYALATIQPHMSIRNADMITWRSPQDRQVSPDRVGFMSQVSPDGRYVVTRLSGPGESLQSGYYVSNFKDYRFLQVFYPTRGILSWYDRATGRVQPLPGADDPKYVQADAFWSPDGKTIVFARAEARDAYPAGKKIAEYTNSPDEVQIQYDLYRIPFNGGNGGTPVPIAGASANGMSNNFPKVSPDGRWIVFIQCRNGQLMRPDSKLYIVPFEGGQARLMNCNTPLMNSWHSFSPNGRWMVFSSKSRSPYTQMFLTHIDENGNDSPAILIENSTAANRAVNIPEFVNVQPDGLLKIDVPAGDYYRQFDIASDLAKKGEYEASISEWRKAIELNPSDARAYVGMGVALASTGDAKAGMALYRKAMEIDPESPDAYSQLGIALARQGSYDDAIPYLSKAIELNPQDALTPGNLCGALALSKGRIKEAIEYCQQAVTALPEDAQSRANLAIALSNAGRADEAIAQLEKASELSPGDAAIHRNLAVGLAQRGRLDDAIQHLEKAMKLAPGFTDGYFYLGAMYSNRGRLAEALAQWRRLVELQPDHTLALNSLARALATAPDASLRNGAEAVGFAERAARLSGGREPVLLDTLAAAYAEAGRFPDAVQTERRALEVASQGPTPQIAAELKARLSLYEAGKAFHER